MENSEISLCVLDDSSLEQQVNVYRAAFAPCSSLKENLYTWRKKHYENPLGNSIIIGAYIEGQLVGINAYLPVEYSVNGEHVKLLQSCESGVLPTCQGKGIWKKVVNYALKYIKDETDFQLVIGFPNYLNSYPGFKKMGWKTVTNMKNYVMVNNLAALKSSFKGKGFLFRFLLNGIILQRSLIAALSFSKVGIDEIPLEDLIWSEEKEGVLQCCHTLSLLKWKKDYKELHAIGIKRNDILAATCLYGLSTYNGKPIIKLESFGFNPLFVNKRKRLLSTFLSFFAKRHPEVSFIRTWSQEHTKQESLYKSLLFLGSSHPNPFITSDPQSKYSDMQWNLSFFDLD